MGCSLRGVELEKLPQDVQDDYLHLRDAGPLGDEVRDQRLAELSTERRLRLKQWIGAELQGEANPNSFDQALLVYLGDEEITRRLAELLIHGDGRQSADALALLRTWHDPRAIEAIGPVFLLDDDSEVADLATQAVLEMIPKIAGFRAEVYPWDREVGQGLGYFGRRILREWWKANAIHFQRRDYLAVQPGNLPPKDGYEPYRAADGTYHMRMEGGEAANWTPSLPPKKVMGEETTPATPLRAMAALSKEEGGPARKSSVAIGSIVMLILLFAFVAGGAIYVTRRK